MAITQQTETDFQRTVIDLAHLYGWTVAHFRGVRIQRKDGSVYYQTPVQADGKGFVDLVLVRERVVWAELKAENGRVSLEQQAWLDRLAEAGQEVYLWKPSDEAEIQEVLE